MGNKIGLKKPGAPEGEKWIEIYYTELRRARRGMAIIPGFAVQPV
jgi:hypothetical protein